jgi:hypothetical protein
MGKTLQSKPRILDRFNIPLGQPLDLTVRAVLKTAIRCSLLSTGEPITFRKARYEVEGEIITVKASKVWQHKNTVYMTGDVIGSRLDVKALGLQPLGIKEVGLWDPSEEDLVDSGDPFEKYYLPIMAHGPRRQYEMEQVIPFQDPQDWDSDPILQASEAFEMGDYQTAHATISELLSADIRCLDAHAHLGNWLFNATDRVDLRLVHQAKRHYEAGVRIGELGLSDQFRDVLPWGCIDNRPFLRCMHGFGLCLWRLEDYTAARDVFERMLWLNPSDNQGVRFLLADIDAGRSWYQAYGDENGTLDQ